MFSKEQPGNLHYQPRYLQIRDLLYQRIQDIVAAGGNRLPREEDLCVEYAVCRSTAAKAIELLVEEKLVCRIQKRGTMINRDQVELRLRRSSARQLGLVFPITRYWQTAVNAMRETAVENGYSLVIFPYDWMNLESEAEACRKAQQSCRGIIIYPNGLVNDKELIDTICRSGYPIVQFDLYFKDSLAGCVSLDNFYGAYHLVDSLLRDHRKKVGLIICNTRHITAMERAAGYRAALAQHGIADSPELVLDLDMYEEASQEQAIVDYIQTRRPGGIFFTLSNIAVLGCHLLTKLGFKIPEDVRLAKCDYLEMNDFMEQYFNTAVQPEADMGRLAVQQVLEQITFPAHIRQRTFLLPELKIHQAETKKTVTASSATVAV